MPEPLTTQDMQLARQARDWARSGAARRAREAAGVSVADMAAAAGASSASIIRWEAGDRSPRARAAIAYGRVLRDLIAVL